MVSARQRIVAVQSVNGRSNAVAAIGIVILAIGGVIRSAQAQTQPEPICPPIPYPFPIDPYEVAKKGPGADPGSTQLPPPPLCRPDMEGPPEGGGPTTPGGGTYYALGGGGYFFPYGMSLEPNVATGCLSQDWIHPSKWVLANPDLIATTRTITSGNLTGKESDFQLLMSEPATPAAISAFEGQSFELHGQSPPGQATLRDFFGVTLSSGQIDVSLPTGIRFAGPIGNDFELKVNFRSQVQRRGILGPFASFNYEDSLVIDKIVPGGSVDCQSPTPSASTIRTLVNSTPYINRLKGGAVQTWTNVGKPAIPPGSLFHESAYFAAVSANAFGPVFQNNPGCFFANASGLAPTIPGADSLQGAMTQQYKMPRAGKHVSQPVLCDPNLLNLNESDSIYYNFSPPVGTLESLDWDCNGSVITDSDGTITVYGRFYLQKTQYVCTNLAGLPPLNGGGGTAPGIAPSAAQQKSLVHLRMVAPALFRQTRDGLRMWYIYNVYGQLIGWRDSMGREVVLSYGALGDGSLAYAESANTVMMVKAEDGRECHFMYGGERGALTAIALPEAATGAPGQPSIDDRVIRIAIDTETEAHPPGYWGPKPINDPLGQPELYWMKRLQIAAPGEATGQYTFDANLEGLHFPDGAYEGCRVTDVTYASARVPSWFPGAKSGTKTTYSYTDVTPACSLDSTWTVTERIYDVNDGTSASALQQVVHTFDAFANETKRVETVKLTPTAGTQEVETNYEYSGIAKYFNLKTAEIAPDLSRVDWKHKFQAENITLQNWYNCDRADFFSWLNVVEEKRTPAPNSGLSPLITEYEYGPYNQIRAEYFPRVESATKVAKVRNVFDTDEEIAEGPAPVPYPIGAIVKSIAPSDGGLQGESVTLYEYSQYGQLKTVTDSLGRVKTFTYHATNDPDGDLNPNWMISSGPAPSTLPGYLKSEVVDPAGLALTTEYKYDIRGNETETIFPEGNRVVTAYNGMDQAYRIAKGLFTGSGLTPHVDPTESFAGAGFEKEYRIFDINGNVTDVRRFNNDAATASSTVNPGVVTTVFEYDGLDRMVAAQTELVSPTSATTNWASTKWLRDALGRITREVRPDGSVTSVTYAPQGKVLSHQTFANELAPGAAPTSDPAANATADASMTFEFDAMGRMTKGTDGEGDSEELRYDGFGRPIGRKDPQGTWLYQELDARSQPIVERIYAPETAFPPTGLGGRLSQTNFVFDNRSRLTSRTDLRFTVTASNVETMLGDVTTSYEYDSEDQVKSQTNENVGVYDFEYDAAGRRTKEKYPNLLNNANQRNVDEYVYDKNGNVETMTVTEWGIPDGGSPTASVYTIDHEYDGLNRETKAIRAKGTPLEAVTESVYDSLSRLTKTKEPKSGGQVVGTKFWYDTLGRNVKIVEGYDSTFSGAAPGLATVAANADGLVTLLKNYDLAGNIASESDDLGYTTSYQYDGQQRKTRVTYADGTYETLAYRKDGLAGDFDAYSAAGEHLFTIHHTYGSGATAKRLTREEATPLAGVYSGLWKKDFVYDALGRPTHAEAESENAHNFNQAVLTKTNRTYDSLGRVLTDTQEILDQASPTAPWISRFYAAVTSTYDDTGNITQTHSSIGSNGELRLQREYDLLSRLTRVKDISQNTILSGAPARDDIVAEYDWRGGRGRVETIRHPWNLTKTQYNEYDLRGRVGKIETKLGNALLAGRQYGYAPSGVKNYEMKLGGPGSYAQDDHVYDHDALDRLTKVRQGDYDPSSGGGTFVGTPTTEQLDMDGAGSIRQHTVPNVAQPYTNATESTNSYTSTYNAASKEWEGEFDGAEVDRDLRGNTISLGIMNLAYDVYGHVTGTIRPWVSPIVPTLEFRDAFDRRVYRIFNGEQRAFVFQGEEILQEVVLNSSTGPVPWVRKEYYHGAGIDETVGQRVDGVLYAMHTDAMGTPYAATNVTGNLAEVYDIGPYGEYSVTDCDGGGTIGNRIGLAGMWYDSVSNLYFMRARHYSPFLKRFVSRDPIGVWGDTSGRGNGYGYAAYSPSLFRDPSGLIVDGTQLVEKAALEAAKKAALEKAKAEAAKRAAVGIGAKFVARMEGAAALVECPPAAVLVGLIGAAATGFEIGKLVAESAMGDDPSQEPATPVAGPAPAAPTAKPQTDTNAQPTLRVSPDGKSLVDPKGVQVGKELDEGDAWVVRAGTLTAKTVVEKSAYNPSIGKTGFSAQSEQGRSILELASQCPAVSTYGKLSISTRNTISSAKHAKTGERGFVERSSGQGAFHNTVGGLEPQQMSDLFIVVSNPLKMAPLK